MASNEWLEDKAEQEKQEYGILTEELLDNLERCRVCGEFFDKDSEKLYRYNLCVDCIEKHTTPWNLIQFVQQDEIAQEFYIEFIYNTVIRGQASKDLIKLCKAHFTNNYSEYERIKKLLEFVKQDFNYFVDWLETKI